MKVLEDIRSFGGRQLRLVHDSIVCQCAMTFSLYLPPQAEDEKVPLIWWLSGLTCTDQNFVIKAGAQRLASQLGLAVICPDTSPRGEEVADGMAGEWDFGKGAGFYVNATKEPYLPHYQMYDYIQKELPQLVGEAFPLNEKQQSIFGHSMGGHGALVLALRNPGQYKACSAFAPVVAPASCPWGEKAFSRYLGEEQEAWQQYDATSLVQQHGTPLSLLIDQGTADPFLETQLRPELFQKACAEAGVALELNLREGYDHSYFFIASYLEDHFLFHNHFLR